MAIKNELSILTKAEQADLYSPPILSLEQQRLYFTLNEIELTELKRFRLRNHRCYFIALLGYFKSKPIILASSFSLIFDDMQFISAEIQGSKRIRPFSVNKVQRDRIYLRILRLLNYQKWDESRHFTPLFDHLVLIGNAWLEPRYLFDAATEYLAVHRIAIPKYTVLQRLISRVIQHVKKSLSNTLRMHVSSELKEFLNTIIDDQGEFSLRHLRTGAKSVMMAELKKELSLYQQLQPYLERIDNAVDSLALSPKNQQHFGEMVDYYGSKLKRFSRSQQYLWLLCFLTQRIRQSLERLTDGFIYHIRKQQEAAHAFAQQAVFDSWRLAADNVTKAAELLHLFVMTQSMQTSHLQQSGNRR